MLVIKSIFEVKNFIKNAKRKGYSIGFVATMGALHDGHLSLLCRSTTENKITICSIFVNPTQFNNNIDYKKYPNTIENDINLLKTTACSAAFTPSKEEMYPAEFSLKTNFNFKGIDLDLEGKFRPSHFNGVAQVVLRLFDIITPNKAYFGQKDYQQLLIIKLITEQQKLPIEIIGCETLRTGSGLAMSSRNYRLNKEEIDYAAFIFKMLTKAKSLVYKKSGTEIEQEIVMEFENNPVFKLEYFEIRDANDFSKIEQFQSNQEARAFVAANIRDVRLIDNLVLSELN